MVAFAIIQLGLNFDGVVMDIQSEIARVHSFVDKGNYHAAINIALSAMNECRRMEQQAGIDTFIEMIKDIANKLADEFGS